MEQGVRGQCTNPGQEIVRQGWEPIRVGRRLGEQWRHLIDSRCRLACVAAVAARGPREDLRHSIIRSEWAYAAAASAAPAARLGEVAQSSTSVGGADSAPERVHGAACCLVKASASVHHADVAE